MVYFIPTPIGNLEDISHRSLKLLMRVSKIFCEDTRLTKKLLHLLEEKFQIQNHEKTYISFHSHNEDEVLKKIDIDQLKTQDWAFVSDAGMPCISDPGAKLVQFCQKNQIPYEVYPGANAALLAFVASGFLEASFTFFGFLPHKGKERQRRLEEILNHPHTSIIYESPHRIELLAKELSLHEGQRKVFFLKEATKKHEKFFKCDLGEIYELIKNTNQKGEWVVVLEKNPNPNPQTLLNVNDVLDLDIKPKQKAKLLSKITNKSSQEWYQKLSFDKKSQLN
ncbi:MAG: 16S rRNA (cytidine(1402)-2'-O)-methyltransferase [Proteobacteria bacterium]|nr:MAG: 16S rRNA (cytidine(1402)-2'-O)-methyltransferase [Pseudomonadota bacterium]